MEVEAGCGVTKEEDYSTNYRYAFCPAWQKKIKREPDDACVLLLLISAEALYQ
jgi:hypothetical protein